MSQSSSWTRHFRTGAGVDGATARDGHTFHRQFSKITPHLQGPTMTSIRRKQKLNMVKLTTENRDEVCALLDAAPLLTTGPSPMSPDYIAVTVASFRGGEPGAAIVVLGDTIVTTDTDFAIHIDDQVNVPPRTTVPRYTMTDNESWWIRQVVWTPEIRKKHADGYGFSTHRCHCQFGKSWQCAEAGLHHKCIYGRESTSWHSPGPETAITWPDGTDAMFPAPVRITRRKSGETWADHRAIVWLSDRECVTQCACDCHQDILSFPPEPMSEDAAAWVRTYAWTPKMRKTFEEVPGSYLRCGCQGGMTGHCDAGRHGKCRAGEARVTVEGWITNSSEIVLDSRGGQVWLADRDCRYRCPCGCHDGQVPPASAREDVAPDDPVQLDLFG